MKDKFPNTMAIRFLEDNNIPYIPKMYKYIEKGGTTQAAKELSIDAHKVIKTIIMEDSNKKPFICLMHGDKLISEKKLARSIGAKSVQPCNPDVANKYSGYIVGGTSPFGTKQKMKVYIEKSILDLDKIYINGGKRGFLVEINPENLKVLDYCLVEVGY